MSKIADKVLLIFSTFTLDRPRLRLDEIAQKSGIPGSTLYRFLQVLLKDGYLVKDSPDQTYRLGPALLLLGRVAEVALDVRTFAIPWMDWLLEKTGGHPISVWVKFNMSRLCLESCERKGGGIKFSAHPGEIRPLYAGAAGKVLLAYMRESEVKAILQKVRLDRITPRTVTDPKRLLKQLANIRVHGYAYSEGEYVPGAFTISAPLLNIYGAAEACLSISGVLKGKHKPPVDDLLRNLLEATHNISEKLGYIQKKSEMNS